METEQRTGSEQLAPRRRYRLPWDLPVEQWRLATAGAAFVLGSTIALVALWGDSHPLVGSDSLSEHAALIAAGTTAVTYAGWFIWALRGPDYQWRHRVPILVRVIDFLGLTLTHAAIALLALSGVFWILSQAFKELRLDAIAGGTIVGAGCAVAAYLTVGSATSLNARQVSQLLAVFVASGALSSMLTASDPLWWQSHFSSLGAATDVSGLAFNFTLLLSGLVITTLSGYLTHDLMMWARLTHTDPRRVRAVRISILAMGILLAGLAFLPVDRFFLAHNIVAYSMVGVFLLMAIGVPLLFPNLSRPFSVVCLVTLSVLVLGLVAYLGVGYLNLTAFELLMVAGVFTWVILLIGTVDSAVQHRQTRPALTRTERADEAETSDQRRPITLG